MILAIAIAMIVILIDAVSQAFMIEKKHIYINHTISAIVAFLYCLGIAYVCIDGTAKIITGTIVLLAFRFLFFDLFLNIWRGLPFFYIGITDKKDAKSDKFLQMLPNPETNQFIIKFALIFISLILYLLL